MLNRGRCLTSWWKYSQFYAHVLVYCCPGCTWRTGHRNRALWWLDRWRLVRIEVVITLFFFSLDKNKSDRTLACPTANKFNLRLITFLIPNNRPQKKTHLKKRQGSIKLHFLLLFAISSKLAQVINSSTKAIIKSLITFAVTQC